MCKTFNLLSICVLAILATPGYSEPIATPFNLIHTRLDGESCSEITTKISALVEREHKVFEARYFEVGEDCHILLGYFLEQGKNEFRFNKTAKYETGTRDRYYDFDYTHSRAAYGSYGSKESCIMALPNKIELFRTHIKVEPATWNCKPAQSGWSLFIGALGDSNISYLRYRINLAYPVRPEDAAKLVALFEKKNNISVVAYQASGNGINIEWYGQGLRYPRSLQPHKVAAESAEGCESMRASYLDMFNDFETEVLSSACRPLRYTGPAQEWGYLYMYLEAEDFGSLYNRYYGSEGSAGSVLRYFYPERDLFRSREECESQTTRVVNFLKEHRSQNNISRAMCVVAAKYSSSELRFDLQIIADTSIDQLITCYDRSNTALFTVNPSLSTDKATFADSFGMFTGRQSPHFFGSNNSIDAGWFATFRQSRGNRSYELTLRYFQERSFVGSKVTVDDDTTIPRRTIKSATVARCE